MSALATNKRARFDYEILNTYQAGLVLKGYEAKAIKEGNVSLKGAYVSFQNVKGKDLPELYLVKTHVGKYKPAGKLDGYDPERPRKLLLGKSEIKSLVGKKQEQGLTLMPLKLYTKSGFVKLELALARGKKKYDKREDIKKRDSDRRLRTLTKRKDRN